MVKCRRYVICENKLKRHNSSIHQIEEMFEYANYIK